MMSQEIRDADDRMPWQPLKLDGEVVGFSRQISDRVCVVVKLPVGELSFYFAEHLKEDNVMRFGVRGFGITDASP